MSIDELRKQIDETDTQIARLIAGRMKIAAAIGKEKEKLNKQVVDPGRENRVLEHVRGIATSENVDPEQVESVYRHIIVACRGQQQMTVAFQGEPGAYSEEAAHAYFGQRVQTAPCETLDDVFQAVEQDATQTGIVPIENSLEGSISRSYDLLLDSKLMVSGEIELRISHCLIASPGASLDSVKKIYSHPQALGQSRVFLKHLNAEIVPSYDTAGSVKMIKEKGILNGAAVAGARAAELYGMKILAREIEDNPNNFTRFFILSKKDAAPTGNDKTSIVFSLKHRPGALYEFLRELADRKINLTKIESRPTRKKAWEYNFYLDFEGHHDDAVAREALAKVETYSIFLKVLGSYPKAK